MQRLLSIYEALQHYYEALRQAQLREAMSVRSWIFTLNNYTKEECEEVDALKDRCTRMYVAKEVSTSGTPHLQGYCTFTRTYRLAGVRILLPRAHWEVANGDWKANRKYILEEKPPGHGQLGEPMVCLEVAQQGHRSDLEEAAALMVQFGARRVAEESPATFVRHHRGLSALQAALFQHRTTQPQMIWLSGESGTGKSTWPFERWEPEQIFTLPTRTSTGHVMWWDGYTQQPVILLDDIRPATLSFNEILAIVNHVPYAARTHDGYTPLNSGMVIVTSILPPQDYVAADEPGSQLFRRVTIHVRTTKNSSPTFWKMNQMGIEEEIIAGDPGEADGDGGSQTQELSEDEEE